MRTACRGLAAVALVWCAACGGGETGEALPDLGVEEVPRTLSTALLYFPGPKGRLYGEPRELDLPTDTSARSRAIAEALLAGPANKRLAPLFPAGVELGVVLEGKTGVIILDFVDRERSRPPVGGSTQEAQVVWSIVNSVTHNVAGVERVALLWNGAQPSSFGGHLDTRGALAPRPDLIQQ